MGKEDKGVACSPDSSGCWSHPPDTGWNRVKLHRASLRDASNQGKHHIKGERVADRAAMNLD